MSRLFLFIIGIVVSKSAFGIKASHYFLPSALKHSSCELILEYPDLKKKAVCSGTAISSEIVLTAKHCLFNDPRVGKLEKPNSENEFLDLKNISLKCQGQEQILNGYQLHPGADIAFVTVKSGKLNPLPMAAANQVDQIAKQPENYQCGTFGFGLDNENKMHNLNGVIISDLEALSFRESALSGALDYDFNGNSFYLANSMFSVLPIDRASFPHLFNQVERAGIDQQTLEMWHREFLNRLQEEGLKVGSIFSPIEGPEYEAIFKQTFYQIYKMAFNPYFNELELEKELSGTPQYSFFVNVENSTLEKSGMDSGDSGGALACLLDGQWKLIGVNSQRMDSNLGHVPKPWEPMHSRPASRITKNGEATPLTEALQSWIFQSK